MQGQARDIIIMTVARPAELRTAQAASARRAGHPAAFLPSGAQHDARRSASRAGSTAGIAQSRGRDRRSLRRSTGCGPHYELARSRRSVPQRRGRSAGTGHERLDDRSAITRARGLRRDCGRGRDKRSRFASIDPPTGRNDPVAPPERRKTSSSSPRELVIARARIVELEEELTAAKVKPGKLTVDQHFAALIKLLRDEPVAALREQVNGFTRNV
jgi:hypothetical protein